MPEMFKNLKDFHMLKMFFLPPEIEYMYCKSEIKTHKFILLRNQCNCCFMIAIYFSNQLILIKLIPLD